MLSPASEDHSKIAPDVQIGVNGTMAMDGDPLVMQPLRRFDEPGQRPETSQTKWTRQTKQTKPTRQTRCQLR